MSASPTSYMPLLQVAAERGKFNYFICQMKRCSRKQIFDAHKVLLQSVFALHPTPFMHFFPSVHEPPQSVPVSSGSLMPLLQLTAETNKMLQFKFQMKEYSRKQTFEMQTPSVQKGSVVLAATVPQV